MAKGSIRVSRKFDQHDDPKICPRECPVCGELTDENDVVAAIGYLFPNRKDWFCNPVYAHEMCLAKCVPLDDEAEE
jgi:hypothetical protein